MRIFYCCLTLATAFCVFPLAASAQSASQSIQNQSAAKAIQAHSYHKHRHGHRHGHYGYRKYWVCYNYRSNFYHYGQLHFRYYGCFKSNLPCHKRWIAGHKARHFGKYSSPGARNGGYYRCLRSSPKFISGHSI